MKKINDIARKVTFIDGKVLSQSDNKCMLTSTFSLHQYNGFVFLLYIFFLALFSVIDSILRGETVGISSRRSRGNRSYNQDSVVSHYFLFDKESINVLM